MSVSCFSINFPPSRNSLPHAHIPSNYSHSSILALPCASTTVPVPAALAKRLLPRALGSWMEPSHDSHPRCRRRSRKGLRLRDWSVMESWRSGGPF